MRQSLGQTRELVDFAAIDRLEQGFARREVTVERADADAGALGDSLEARLGPPTLNTRVAAFSRRSRLRSESARGLRSTSALVSVERTAMESLSEPLLKNGGRLRICIRRLPPFNHVCPAGGDFLDISIELGSPQCLSPSA